MKKYRMTSVPDNVRLKNMDWKDETFVLRGTASPDYFEVHPGDVDESQFGSSKFLGIVSRCEVKNHFEEIE